MTRIRLEKRALPRLRKTIYDELRGHNRPFIGEVVPDHIVVTARAADGRFMGGIAGYVRLTWLYIDLLWLEAESRGQGTGSMLLRAIEKEARRRGAGNAHVSSWTFQAPGFYETLGYHEFGRLRDYPDGYDCVFLAKSLRAEGPD